MRVVLLAGLIVLATAGSASAQVPTFRPTPTTSPFLNLNRPGNQAINYYNLVRPEVEFRNSVNSLSQQVGALNSSANAPVDDPSLLSTGHPVQFQNYGTFFPTPLVGGRRAGFGATGSRGGLTRPIGGANLGAAAVNGIR